MSRKPIMGLGHQPRLSPSNEQQPELRGQAARKPALSKRSKVGFVGAGTVGSSLAGRPLTERVSRRRRR